MKKMIAIVLCLIIVVALVGCGAKSTGNVIEGNIRTYAEMSDGTWECDDNTYEYRLEISGKMPNADKDTTFVYLSNLKEITFEQALKASGISSNLDDYFDGKDAVLVEMKTE